MRALFRSGSARLALVIGGISVALVLPGILLSAPGFAPVVEVANRTPPSYLVVANYLTPPADGFGAMTSISRSVDLGRGTNSLERILITFGREAVLPVSVDIYRAHPTDATLDFDDPTEIHLTVSEHAEPTAERWCYVVGRNEEGSILAAPGDSPRLEFSPLLAGDMPDDVAVALDDSAVYEDASAISLRGRYSTPWTEHLHVDLENADASLAGVACVSIGDLAPLSAQARRFYAGAEVSLLQLPGGVTSVVSHDSVTYPGDWIEQPIVAIWPPRDNVDLGGIPVSPAPFNEYAKALGFTFRPLAVEDPNARDEMSRNAWVGALLLGAWLGAIISLPFLVGDEGVNGTGRSRADLRKRGPQTIRREALRRARD